MNGLSIPKMKINGFKKIMSMNEIDRFSGCCSNGYSIDLIVFDSDEGKYFAFDTPFMFYGWTRNSSDAFKALHNMSLYSNGEFFDQMRGK